MALGHHKRPDPVAISDEARARFESMKEKLEETKERQFSVPGGLDPKAFLNRLILGAFTGQDINVTGLVNSAETGTPETPGLPARLPVDGALPVDGTTSSAGASGFSASVEQLSFSASGTIKTRDGEEVGFTLELNMTRASMSGYSAAASADPRNGLSVNFGGSSAELFSMNFEFNIVSGEEGEQSGLGSFNVDKPEADAAADEEHEGHEEDGQASLASSVPDFLKMLRRAEFTSTYLSFSRTTVEASSSFAESQPIDVSAAPIVDAGTPQLVDLVA